jgi:hypothetical protein
MDLPQAVMEAMWCSCDLRIEPLRVRLFTER